MLILQARLSLLLIREGKESHPVTIMGTVCNDRKKAGTKLKSLISQMQGRTLDMGEYRGFKLSIFFDTLTKHVSRTYRAVLIITEIV